MSRSQLYLTATTIDDLPPKAKEQKWTKRIRKTRHHKDRPSRKKLLEAMERGLV